MTPPISLPQSNPIETYARFEDDHWWYVGRRHIMRSIAHNLVAPSESRVVLDVGCGPGANIAALSDDYNCVGTDNSAEAIETATRRFPKVQFVCGAAPADVADVVARADLITVMDVLEHVPDDSGLVRKLVEEAKPTARILITVPSEPDLWSPHDDAVGHLRRYTRSQFEALWQGLPVRTLLVSPFNSRLYVPIKLARLVSRRRGKAHGGAATEGTDLRLPLSPVNGALASLFMGESRTLLKGLLTGSTRFRKGVSLIAVLERVA
jgi:2-polyprenyl-3-methyl-5-hydroxy-6-metoxy-1,4-benzoquinol methylase